MSDIAGYQTDLSDYQSAVSQYQNVLSKLQGERENLRDTIDTVAPLALDYALRRGPGFIGGAVGKVFGKDVGDKVEAAAGRIVNNEGGVVQGLRSEATNLATSAVSENVPTQFQGLANAAIAGDVGTMQSEATGLASGAIAPTQFQGLANAALAGDTGAMQAAQPAVDEATTLASDVAGRATNLGFRTISSLQDSATSAWGSDSTIARAMSGDQIFANLKANRANTVRDLFGQNQQQQANVVEPEVAEEVASRPPVNYNQPDEFVSPKTAPGTSTELTSFAGDTVTPATEASDFTADAISTTAATDVPTAIAAAAGSDAATVLTDVGTTALGVLGGVTEGLLDTPLAPLALFTGLGAVLDKVFNKSKAPVFNPSLPEFQSGF
jgi:hypothetical protein